MFCILQVKVKDTKHIVLLFICAVFDIIYYEEDIQHWMCVIDYIYYLNEQAGNPTM